MFSFLGDEAGLLISLFTLFSKTVLKMYENNTKVSIYSLFFVLVSYFLRILKGLTLNILFSLDGTYLPLPNQQPLK